ncbi:hypothetical protein BWR17_19255 (plasmid) [Phaeobacter inhibens]|uniref:ABC transporter ATP-binding protein n=1 Tax=Phaeobacter inhibens TaxID=221822 RepID=UPI000971B30A|nr:ABC transporter ATP-binding protein [Phaeobacter inhibens]APX18026.1 hypothetical protein BWR17_19255 [Phaeobacter inhibens]
MDLILDEIGKCYGATWVLEHIDLTIKDGEFFSLLGGSGSGKTTLLKSIAGIERPDRGRILFDGRDIVATPMEQRPFNTVFQGYALFPHMSVFDNVAFGLRVKGIDSGTIRKTVTEMAERVGLSERIHAFPAQLSGGQQQRVAIARVLVCEPQVILLDEPLSALDASLRGQMQRFLKELHRDLGLTFIFVTHDQDEAMSLSDRICILNQGRIEQVDTPDALYHAPSTTYVAEFIGTNNLIPVSAGGETEFGRVSFEADGDATLSIRPEAIEIGAASDALSAAATLVDRQFHGDNTVMTFRTGSGRELIVRRPGRGEAIEIGGQAELSLPRAACTLIPEGRAA